MKAGEYVYRRLDRYEIQGDSRFLTFSCYDRLPLFSNDRIKQAFVDRLEYARCRFKFRLIAWVIMPEHVHLLILPGQAGVREILENVKGRFAQRVIGRWKSLDARILARIQTGPDRHAFWLPGGGYDRNINSSEERREKINYIHQNPVKRGLVGSAIEWKWSSARWYAGETQGPVITRLD